MTIKCSQNHKISRECHEKAATACRKCDAEAQAKQKRQQREYELDQERQAKQHEYARKLEKIDDEIEHQKRLMKFQADEIDRKNALAQKKADLANLKDKAHKTQQATQAQRADIAKAQGAQSDKEVKIAPVRGRLSISASENEVTKSAAAATPPAAAEEDLPDWDKSEAKDDWEWQKQYDGAANESLDSLMPMIGMRPRIDRVYRCSLLVQV